MAVHFETNFLSSEEIRKLSFREMLDYVIRNNLFLEISSISKPSIVIYSETGTLFDGKFNFYGIEDCEDQICLLLSLNRILKLSLSDIDIDFGDDAEDFFDALQRNTALKVLRLSNYDNLWQDVDHEKFINALFNKQDLEHFGLENIVFTPGEALKVAKICSELPKLRILELADCCEDLCLGDCKALLRTLGKSLSIQEIQLHGPEWHPNSNVFIALSQILEEDYCLFRNLTDAGTNYNFYDTYDDSEEGRRMTLVKKSVQTINHALKVRTLNREKFKKRVDEVLGLDFIRRARKQHKLAISTVTDDAIQSPSPAITNDTTQFSSVSTSSDSVSHYNLLSSTLVIPDTERKLLLQQIDQKLEEIKKKINNLRESASTVLEVQSELGNATSSVSVLTSTSAVPTSSVPVLISTLSTSTSLLSSSSSLPTVTNMTSSLLSTSSSSSSSTDDVSTLTPLGSLNISTAPITVMSSAFISSASLILPLGKRTREDWDPEDENNDKQGNGSGKKPK